MGEHELNDPRVVTPNRVPAPGVPPRLQPGAQRCVLAMTQEADELDDPSEDGGEG
jgi:hypothetical protein